MSNTPSRRFIKLAGMTANIASKAITSGIRSMNASGDERKQVKSELYTSIGQQLVDTLGEMKGAVMKVGQMLSQYRDILPTEIAEQIATLQRRAPSVPFSHMEDQITKELGKPLSELFAHIDRNPFASASIGQVHRATLLDGTSVVVKVQYPGVDECCISDLKQIRIALRLAGVFKVNRELQDKLFKEFETSLLAELDYLLEAHHLNTFYTFHKNLDQGVIIPRPIEAYTTKRVLTLTEELGDSIEEAASYPLDTRNIIAKRIFKLLSDQIFLLQSFHCDSHPGNFAFRPDGSVVVYDFGGIKELDQPIIDAYRGTVNAAREHNIANLELFLRNLEVRNYSGQIPADFYRQWIDVLMRPMIQPFDFSTSTVHQETLELVRKSFKYISSFQPSPHTLMINRAVIGHYWNMVTLKAHTDFSDLLALYVPAHNYSTVSLRALT